MKHQDAGGSSTFLPLVKRPLPGWLAAGLALAVCAPAAWAQGVASTGVQARPKKPLPPGLTAPKVEYRDIAGQAGLTAVADSGAAKGKEYIVESTGTGVATFDYDNDGLVDIFLVNGGRFGPDDEPIPHPAVYAYRNLGNLKFEEVTDKIGVAHTGWGQGACAGDFDNDGATDLVVTHWGRNRLFRNQGDGTFQDVTAERGLPVKGRRWSSGCAFLDYDRDGDLDLFVANYLDFDPEETPKPGEHAQCRWKGIPVLCGPRGLPGETMSLYRNDGRRFLDVSDGAGVTTDKIYYGFTPLTADYDNDGWVDIYVACDSTASLFYHNQGDGTFDEIGVISGTAYNMDGMEQAGMGATAADFDRDGDLDIFKTNFSNDTHTLYQNEGQLMFMDETVSTGLAVNTQFLGWGTAFLDFDHDGWKDIFAANGHVYPAVNDADINERFRQQRLLYWNRRDGEFYDISDEAGPGILAKHSSRGIAIADLDNGGSLEIVTVNMHEPPSLLKNYGEKGNSILIGLRTAGGRYALGARIKVTTSGGAQIDEVRSGGYHISQSDFRLHFGLADAETADIEVRWLGGPAETFTGVKANQWVEIRRCKKNDGEKPCKSKIKTKQKFTPPGQATTEARPDAAGSEPEPKPGG